MLAFDHAVISVMGQMDAAAERFESLGFHLTPRGYHTLGSINHLAVFDGCYVELLGYAPGEREKRAEMWVYPAGLTGLALRPDDVAATHAALEAAGIPLEPYKEFSRPVTLNGETRDASFRTFQIDRERTANGRLFYCQHLTPELIWREEYLRHPNGATGIAAATVACLEPETIRALFARTPEIEELANGDLKAGETILKFRDPGDLEGQFGAIDLPPLDGKTMRMCCLDIACASLETVAELFRHNGIAFDRQGEALVVSPDIAFGVILRFVPQG